MIVTNMQGVLGAFREGLEASAHCDVFSGRIITHENIAPMLYQDAQRVLDKVFLDLFGYRACQAEVVVAGGEDTTALTDLIPDAEPESE